MADVLMKKLQSIAVCKGLTPNQTKELIAIADETSAKKGAILFKEGDIGDALLVVLEGQVEVTKRGASLAKLDSGAVLGEMSLLDGDSRSATATALTDVKYLKISSTRFEKLLSAENVGALKIVANLAQVMSRRLAMINEKLVDSLGKGTQKKEELADFGRILNRWSF
jgi:CRP-like cAMP-binding protein